MRTTIDIPDETFKQVKRFSVENDRTMRQMVLEGLQLVMQSQAPSQPQRRLQLPLIRSSQPGTLNLTNEQIQEILDADLVESARAFARR